MSPAFFVSPVTAVALGRCPACGRGKLFSGVVSVAASCAVCGANFRPEEVGDGFTVPVLLLLGFMVMGGALWVDFNYEPPLWVHALIWLPLTAFLAVVLTRLVKGFLVVQNWRLHRG